MPRVPSRPEIKTLSAVSCAPNSGNMFMSPSFFAIVAMTDAQVAASVIMQNVPIGRTRAMHRSIHVGRSALWWAL